jgi:hypothetical protein
MHPDPPVLLLALLSKLAENIHIRHNGRHGEQRKGMLDRGDVNTTRVQMALTLAAGGQIPPPPPPPNPAQPVELSITTQQNSVGPGLHHLPLHKTTYSPLILMALCIIDFIGVNGLLG